MDVVLDENIVQFIKGQFPDSPEEETLTFRELQRFSQNVKWPKPNYEKIGLRILETYFSPPTVACSEGCNKTISSEVLISGGGGSFMSKQFPFKCEITKALVDEVKNQFVQDMRSLKVRLTKLDERSIFDGTSTKKGLKERDGRSFVFHDAQDISTDSTYETIEELGQEQVSSKKILSIQPSDKGSNDIDNQHPNDCSVLFLKPLTPSATNSMRVTRSKSREKKAEATLLSSSALNEQLISKTTPSMTNSGATATLSLNVVGLANNKIVKAPKNEPLDRTLASSSQSSRSRKNKTHASKTKNMKSAGSQVQQIGDSTNHENFQNCTILGDDCLLPTSKKMQHRDISSNQDSGTLSKHCSVTTQSCAAVAVDPSPKQDLSESGCETSRYGRTIKRVKLTSYDATPAYITALQQKPASRMIRNGQSGRNLDKASYDPKGCNDQQPHRLRVGKDSNVGNDSGSNESYWPGKDVDITPKQKRYTKKLNITMCMKIVSTVNPQSNNEPKQKRRTTSSKVLQEIGPPKITVDETSRAAKQKNRRVPLKKSCCEEGEALRLSNPIGSNLPTNKNDGCLIQLTADSNGKDSLEEKYISEHGVASKELQKSSTVEKQHVRETKKMTVRKKKSDFGNVFPKSEIASLTKKKKLCESRVTEPQDLQRDMEPCKVTAKKGTLTHLKQRQKRQKYLLQQLQEDETLVDFFDDTDNPQIGNFHKKKYQINSKYLNSPVTGDSTACTSFNSSCGSFLQTPNTSKNGKKSNCKKQIGNPSTAFCNIGRAFTPRSALLARFAGDETDGRGWMVNTPTTTSKGGDLGVNLGLAVTPGELLERSVANHIIYNNKMKRPPKRPSATGAPAFNQSVVGLAHSGGSSQSGGRNASSRSLPDGSLGQSPNTSTRAGRLPEVAVDYEYSPAGPKRLKRLMLPSILDDVASQEKEGGSDHDDYFEDSDN